MRTKILIFFLFFWTFITAQNHALTGTIVDENNSPISFVNVVLYQKAESEPFTGTASGEEGNFKLESISQGEYTLEISMIGFKTKTLPITISENISLHTIQIEEDAEQLGKITFYDDDKTNDVGDPMIFDDWDPLVYRQELIFLKNTPRYFKLGLSMNL